MTEHDQRAPRRRLFAWAGPLLMIAALGAMLYSEAYAWIDPTIDGVVLSGLAFAALFIASFWWHTCAGLIIGCLLSLAIGGWRPRLIGALVLIGLGAAYVLGAVRVGLYPPEAPGPKITVMSANLMYGRGSGESLLAQLDAVNPDVLVLQEYTDGFATAHEAELRERFPHAVVIPSDGAFGQATFSRLEFVETPRRYPRTEIKPSNGWPPQIDVMVNISGHDVSVVNVHLLPPTGFTMVADQHRMASGLADAFRDDGSLVILAGDFNSNERGLPVRRVLREGFGSVHSRRGVGLGATWPRTGVLRHVPGTRLDHVLYRRSGCSVLEQGVGDDFGSDHRPVWATLLIDP